MQLSHTVPSWAQEVTTCLRRVGKVPLLLVLFWVSVLWWGERTVFKRSIAACEWQAWESWPPDANPHHVLFVADPQLVDPHTYPGRPWPLSTLTVLYTDLYMRRVYGYLLDHMQPHTTMFLGDLFDGGREWATTKYNSPESRYKKYGTNFWLKEYNRFMNMFVGRWYDQPWDSALTGEGRKIIASLPGNHDLGFAGGVNEHVKSRFEAHFGPSNRIDVLGNHTFVSLDTVSLSAMDQVDPVTGSSGAGDGTGRDTKHMKIWKPVENFLIDAQSQRGKAVQRWYQHLRALDGFEPTASNKAPFDPQVLAPHQIKTVRPKAEKSIPVPSSNFPTIVLSHVPFYRGREVTCGPLRERGDAIPLQAGYQYQNVLTSTISKDIVDHLDAEQITMIYSGDDHDYCEVDHGEFTGRIKEITVKSTSWAMGVRKPGVQLASLWNPVDMEGIARGKSLTSTPRDTVQNHLCLLPDQLSIFIRYGQIFALTILALIVRAVAYNAQKAHRTLASSPTEKDKLQPLLPITRRRTPPSPDDLDGNHVSTSSNTSTARARSNGKLSGYGNLPSLSRSASPITPEKLYPVVGVGTTASTDTDDWGMPTGHMGGTTPAQAYAKPIVVYSHSRSYSSFISRTSMQHAGANAISAAERLFFHLVTPASTKSGECIRSLNLVAAPVAIFYFWLLWNG